MAQLLLRIKGDELPPNLRPRASARRALNRLRVDYVQKHWEKVVSPRLSLARGEERLNPIGMTYQTEKKGHTYMYTLEMMRGTEYLGKFDSSSSWLEESDAIPSVKEAVKMMKAELNYRESPDLRQVVLNVWEGDGDEWMSKLVESWCMFVEEPKND